MTLDGGIQHPSEPVPIVTVGGERRVLVVRPLDFAKGETIAPHRHVCGQLIYAISGLLVVRSPHGSWIVPSRRGVWVPPLTEHAVEVLDETRMRSAYLDASLSAGIAGGCRVIGVPDLLRDLIVFAASRDLISTPDIERSLGTLIAQLVDEAAIAPLDIPIPSEPSLRTIYRALLADPSDPRSIADWARHVGRTERTLVRRLHEETGLTFRIWRQQIRLLSSLERLAQGEPVTTVAFDVGYNTASGFITAFRQSFGTSPAAYFRARSCRSDGSRQGR